MNAPDRFFAVTGGPGSGKSTLIEALARAGYASSVEAGRGVIRDQALIGDDAPALPSGRASCSPRSGKPAAFDPLRTGA